MACSSAWRWLTERSLVALCTLAVATWLPASCGDSEPDGPSASESAGCEASCRILFECTFGAAQAVASCTAACVSILASQTAACREATSTLGTCATGKSCSDFKSGTCRGERDAANAACSADGGLPDSKPSDGSTACARFGYMASGNSCGSSCAPVSCSCEAVPRSVSSCTQSGCIVAADCGAVCAASNLGEAIACLDIYTVRAGEGGVDACSAKPCEDVGATCGSVDDGCGHLVACPGICTAPQTCGGGGVHNQCGCTPRTCAAAAAECGNLDDGCGQTLLCGPGCTGQNWCGGGGAPNHCGCTSGAGTIGPYGARLGADAAGIGTEVWDPADALTSADAPDIPASTSTEAWKGAARVHLSEAQIAHWLTGTNFALNVPPLAVINGIEVTVRRRSWTLSSSIADNAVSLIKGGSVGPVDRGKPDAWTDSYTEVTYGGPADLWGATWTAADLNDPSFGVALSAKYIVAAGNDYALVDQIKVKVYFTMTCS